MSGTPTPAPRPVPRRLVEQALSYISRLQHDPDGPREQLGHELEHWRSRHASHEQAYQLARQYWSQTEAAGLRGHVAKPPGDGERRADRRRAIKALGLAGLAAALGGGGRWWWLQPVQRLALSTGHGQQILAQRLADGSVLDLAAATTLEAVLHRDRRGVHLARGEARFAVARDENRPFSVSTPWGRVQVLGTVFSVAVREQSMTVAVAQGRVSVWPTGPSGEPGAAAATVLEAGQQVETGRAGLLPVRGVSPASVGAWRDGWLVFDHTPLPEVVARWNDYLREPLRLDDAGGRDAPRLAELRLTGSFPLREPAAFLSSLPLMLPVQVVPQERQAVISLR